MGVLRSLVSEDPLIAKQSLGPVENMKFMTIKQDMEMNLTHMAKISVFIFKTIFQIIQIIKYHV